MTDSLEVFEINSKDTENRINKLVSLNKKQEEKIKELQEMRLKTIKDWDAGNQRLVDRIKNMDKENDSLKRDFDKKIEAEIKANIKSQKKLEMAVKEKETTKEAMRNETKELKRIYKAHNTAIIKNKNNEVLTLELENSKKLKLKDKTLNLFVNDPK